MAMLAEPRRRQRIGPNPRGKFFLEDDNNKGRAMLEKLGWQSGDGLGRQNQGMSNPLCPKIQMDVKGLGYDVKNDPWVAHNEEFTEVLKNLQAIKPSTTEGEQEIESSSSDEELPRKKLEKMSKSSRARIHYHKLVKSKDVSNFSKTNLKCIFGKEGESTTPKKAKKKRKSSDDTDKTADSAIDSLGNQTSLPEKSFNEDGVKTINRGSMAEYFTKLFEQKRSRAMKTTSIAPSSSNADEELVGSSEVEVKKEKKSKRRKTVEESAFDEELVPIVPKIEVKNEEFVSIVPEMEVKKEKKSKKRKMVQDDDPSQSNLDELVTIVPKIEVTNEEFVSIVPEVEVKKEKKSKRRKIVEESTFDEELVPIVPKIEVKNEEFVSIVPDMEVKKVKKSKKRKMAEDDDPNQSNFDEELVSTVPKIEVKKEKKSKKKKIVQEDDPCQLDQDADNIIIKDSEKSLDISISQATTGLRPVAAGRWANNKRKLTPNDLQKIAEQFPGANVNNIYGYVPY